MIFKFIMRVIVVVFFFLFFFFTSIDSTESLKTKTCVVMLLYTFPISLSFPAPFYYLVYSPLFGKRKTLIKYWGKSLKKQKKQKQQLIIHCTMRNFSYVL